MPRFRWNLALALAATLVLTGPIVRNLAAKESPIPPVIGSSRDEYGRLQQLIDFYRTHERPQRLLDEALLEDALIWPSDRDPLDIVLCRSGALLEHLEGMEGAPDLWSEKQRLSRQARRAAGISVARPRSDGNCSTRWCAYAVRLR